MCAQEQLGIIEIVKIVDRRTRTELDALDLLQIDKVRLLRVGRHAAELDTREGILERIAKLAAEQRGSAGIIHLEIAGLGGIIHHLTAIQQHHELAGIDVNDRAVGDYVLTALFIVVSLVASANGHALGKDGSLTHGVGFNDLQPLICKCTAHGVHRCFDNTHSYILLYSFCILHLFTHCFRKATASDPRCAPMPRSPPSFRGTRADRCRARPGSTWSRQTA